jgi:anti-sigma regulatory factor (Ser/Thr protein kinase)
MLRTEVEMEETLNLRLAADSKAPAKARHAVDSMQDALAEARSDVSLLVSELVTNAIRHGGSRPDGAVELVATAAPEKVRVEVADDGPGFDPAEAHRDREAGGFGLKLVEKLANRWGVTTTPRARVWFEIYREAEMPSEGRRGTRQKRFARAAHG